MARRPRGFEVAALLGLSASTVRRYKAGGKLYSCLVNGRRVFPV